MNEKLEKLLVDFGWSVLRASYSGEIGAAIHAKEVSEKIGKMAVPFGEHIEKLFYTPHVPVPNPVKKPTVDATSPSPTGGKGNT